MKWSRPTEGRCIGIQCRRDGSRVVVEVTDSGKGIAAEDLFRIFNPFEQIERQEDGAYGRLGLRLALSKSLVELHGGAIKARSEGGGAWIDIFCDPSIGRCVCPARDCPGASVNRCQPANFAILLAEDHGDTARILARLLRNQGHEVRTAGDLNKALEFSRQWEFDLLISDLGLPDGNGRDLMRQLRSVRSEIPGIAISGFGAADDIRQSLAAGFSEHLIKPVEIAALRAAIQRIVSKSAGGQVALKGQCKPTP